MACLFLVLFPLFLRVFCDISLLLIFEAFLEELGSTRLRVSSLGLVPIFWSFSCTASEALAFSTGLSAVVSTWVVVKIKVPFWVP